MNSNAALLLYAGLAVAGLIFLIVRLKVSAFIALTILPAVVIFFSAQKHIVAGLTSGSVKG